MKVLVVPPSYYATNRTIGGGERYAFEYARALADLTPTTLALFDTRSSASTNGHLETRTFSVPTRQRHLVLRFSAETRSALLEYDVIHLMGFPTPASDAFVWYARRHGRISVLTDVGGGARCVSTYLTRINRRWSVSRLANGLAHLSLHAAGFFKDWRHPATVLYGGVALEHFRDCSCVRGHYALYVGRLLPHKGILEFISALPQDLPLRVVGRPYCAAYLKQLQAAAAGKIVTFHHDADDADLAEHYAGAAVVLQPSLPLAHGEPNKSELLGLVALEGMASGKPVIVTNNASLPELVRDGETGFILSPDRPDMWVAHAQRLLATPSLQAEMGAAARKHIETKFIWRRVAEQGLDFYKRLRGKSRGSND